MVDLSDRFVHETTDQLRTLSDSLLNLEEEAAASDSVSQSRVDELFRIAHSLKGRFATEGFDSASGLAHALETVLDAIGNGRLEPTEVVIDDALAAVDTCRTILEESHETGRVRTDATPVREQLRAHVDDAKSADDGTSPGASLDPDRDATDASDDETLSRDVREALDDAAEFDDLDRIVDELDADEGSEADIDGWGVFENPSGESSQRTSDNPAERSSTDDIATGDEVDSFDEFITFREMKEGLDDEEEDLEDLQTDIEAEAFGEFDDDDEMTIEELLDDETIAPPADPDGSPSMTDDLRAFDDVREGVDPAAEDLENLQADIEAEAFGEFDDDDEMTIEELLEADPSELDPEAGFDEVEPAARSSVRDTTTFDAESSAGNDEESARESESDERIHRDVCPPTSEEQDRVAEASGTDLEREDDDEFDLIAENPFDFSTGEEGVDAEDEGLKADDASAPLNEESPDQEFPNIEVPEIGESTDDGAASDHGDSAFDSTGGIDEDFTFGFDQGQTYLDGVEFDSLFSRYISEETFDADSIGSTEASATIAETQLDTERFETAAGSEWRAATSSSADADSIQSLTVDVENADELLRLAEEFGNVQRQFERAVGANDFDAVEEIVAEMRPFTADLHQAVTAIRLMPLEAVFSRLPRVVRDVARGQNKKVDFSITGEDVRLDRNIIERIEDSLVHLVRNAIDHGIEPPAERDRKDKLEEGTLELRASRSRDRVVIELEDDGRGIDVETVREAAVENGLVTEREARTMTREEMLELVFRPQFSTREQVTDVSGRGVGMNVVRETVRDLTGSAEIESTPDSGTTVRLTLPVTVAVSQVLFVYAGGERFAIPASAIDTVELAGEPTDADGLSSVAPPDGAGPSGPIGTLTVDREVTPAGAVARAADGFGAEAPEADVNADADAETETKGIDDPYATIQLADVMGIGESETSRTNREKIVRIREEIRPLELRCDAVGDLEEVVIRPFEDVLNGTPGISGTTTDGENVVPVIDVQSLEP